MIPILSTAYSITLAASMYAEFTWPPDSRSCDIWFHEMFLEEVFVKFFS